MAVVAKLDELGPGAWFALTLIGFIIWWPLGLATLAYFVWSGRMGCWRRGEAWRGGERMMNDRWREATNWWRQPPSSGNRAFDEYRAETLRRLEEEQREFREFLERLRVAKDKTEFDAFMAERRARTSSPPPPAHT
jgi:hypothetical protein